jgi:MFS family permease
MDIFVEDYIKRGAIGRIRTTFFTFMNLGWVCSPMITGLFINDGNYRLVFLVAALCLVPFYFVFARRGKNLHDHVAYDRTEILPTWRRIRDNRDISSIFILSFFLQLFYCLAVVYVPVYLHQVLGFDWTTLGYIFAFMLLPFIIFEIPAGILADKYIGEKEIMTVGFTILIISLLLFFYVDSTNPWLWGAILFFSRIGAALIESMRESYFFKKVSVKNVGIINFFRTAAPLGYIIGTLLGIIILRFYPVNFIFLFLAIFLISSYYFISRFRDTK